MFGQKQQFDKVNMSLGNFQQKVSLNLIIP